MKKNTDQEIELHCKDCYYAIPDESNISVVTGKPIFASCRFQKFKMLLNHDSCKQYKKK